MRFIVSFIASAMPGDACIVCGNNRKKAPELSYHRFPSDPGKRVLWLQALHISEEQVKPILATTRDLGDTHLYEQQSLRPHSLQLSLSNKLPTTWQDFYFLLESSEIE